MGATFRLRFDAFLRPGQSDLWRTILFGVEGSVIQQYDPSVNPTNPSELTCGKRLPAVQLGPENYYRQRIDLK